MRWVGASSNRTISWSIQPHKKSLNFGIFKHPGANTHTSAHLSASTFEPPLTPGVETDSSSARRGSSSRNDASNAAEKLQGIGLIPIRWLGRCEADKVAVGSYDVPADGGGMYALVFDNTFSKQTSKTATLVLMTYPTNTPPQTSHNYHHHVHAVPAAALSSLSLNSASSPKMNCVTADSTSSLPDGDSKKRLCSCLPSQNSTSGTFHDQVLPNYHTGILQKRRRKRHQGYARRFFSLDFTSCTLSYYHNQQSSALRGAVPLSLAVIGANEKTREISLDSGAEVWHLRATTSKDFDAWRCALDRASTLPTDPSATALAATTIPAGLPFKENCAPEEQEWARAETLVGRVAGIRDAVRRLATATGLPPSSENSRTPGRAESLEVSPSEVPVNDYFQDRDRRRFWKRKPSGTNSPSTFFQRSSSGRQNSSKAISSPMASDLLTQRNPPDTGMHGHCLALLNDLDAVVTDFSELVAGSRRRRMPRVMSAISRHSMDTIATGEFFDAEEGRVEGSQLITISGSDDDGAANEYMEDNVDSASDSDAESPHTFNRRSQDNNASVSFFPHKPKTLNPLPLNPVERRSTIPPAMIMPPSLIGFLRKNIGKDLSAISMPVSANEPISLLQRVSEYLEYTSLLDKASAEGLESTERLLYMTAFAISSLSSNRVKERAIRKPFNPMLGETFELIREDQGFRFIAEKVSHRPVRMACQAESQLWTYTHSLAPTQKFWGKSAELITDGKARVVLHTTGDCYNWTVATCFLRNIIAGEKYVEPVGTMTVFDETNGQRATVTFKAKGMFSGRSEEVLVECFGKDGQELPLGLTGKWPSALCLTDQGVETKSIWHGGTLVDNPEKHYGFTTFAASLNEITTIEEGKLPATDSRLRPDQLAVERGDLDRAEVIKAKLEEAQRERRRDLEAQGGSWEPRWFEKVQADGAQYDSQQVELQQQGEEEVVWRLKTGKNGYWEERGKGNWTGVLDLFNV